jgi:hypothetical protein
MDTTTLAAALVHAEQDRLSGRVTLRTAAGDSHVVYVRKGRPLHVDLGGSLRATTPPLAASADEATRLRHLETCLEQLKGLAGEVLVEPTAVRAGASSPPGPTPKADGLREGAISVRPIATGAASPAPPSVRPRASVPREDDGVSSAVPSSGAAVRIDRTVPVRARATEPVAPPAPATSTEHTRATQPAIPAQQRPTQPAIPAQSAPIATPAEPVRRARPRISVRTSPPLDAPPVAARVPVSVPVAVLEASPAAPPPVVSLPRPPSQGLTPVAAGGAVSSPPPRGEAKAPDLDLVRQAVRIRVTQGDYAGADRILAGRIPKTPDAELDAIAAWVGANLTGRNDSAVKALDTLIAGNPTCEHALYHRGLVQKRAGESRLALRDFVAAAKQNPRHAGALLEIKELRAMQDQWKP